MNKKLTILCVAAASMLAACGGKGKQTDALADSIQVATADSLVLVVDSARYAESGNYSEVTLFVAYPKGADSVSVAIRRQLCGEMSSVFQSVSEAIDGMSYKMKPYQGSGDDAQKMVDHCGNQLTCALNAMSKSDYEERVKGAKEYAQEEGEAYQQPILMPYSAHCYIRENGDADGYLVMQRELSLFFGGAHGSTEVAYLTFDKRSGALFTDFLKPDVVNQMQPILRRGLVEYFSAEDQSVNDKNLNDQLMLNSSIIPLPAGRPCPTSKGLLFQYAQYEVASYAAGMPAFVVPYKDIRPYLTDEAISLLGI